MGARTAARALGGKASAESAALVDGLRALIARRQSTVRPDEAPYRPQLRFLVQSDGLRTYHLAYPVLEALRLPMTRQNVDSAEPRRPGDPGRPAGQP
jgi:hypothetical protein